MRGTDEEAEALDGKVQAVLENASLFVGEVVVTDGRKLSIEQALVKSPVTYPNIGSLSKSFIIQAGQNVLWKGIFSNRSYPPVNFMYGQCMVKNFFLSTPLKNSPFSYQIFGVQRVEIQRGRGVPLAGTPLDTSNNVRLYYNTITGLGFTKNGNGIKLEDFDDNHFFMVPDLTSTEEAMKILALFPELTG